MPSSISNKSSSRSGPMRNFSLRLSTSSPRETRFQEHTSAPPMPAMPNHLTLEQIDSQLRALKQLRDAMAGEQQQQRPSSDIQHTDAPQLPPISFSNQEQSNLASTPTLNNATIHEATLQPITLTRAPIPSSIYSTTNSPQTPSSKRQHYSPVATGMDNVDIEDHQPAQDAQHEKRLTPTSPFTRWKQDLHTKVNSLPPDSETTSTIGPEKDFVVTTEEGEPKKTWRFYAAFASLCLVNLVCALDATSLAVALPIVAKALNGSGIEAFWAGTSFLLTATVFQPSFASLSHVFGRQSVLLVALTFFTAGAIIGGVANNFTVLLVGRSIQGVGGGGMSALTYVIVTDMVSLKERGKWFGLITMQWALGSVLGPVIGGAFAEKISWRWIFWINLPFCGLAYIAIPLFLKLKRKEGDMWSKIKQKDWIGSALFIASTTAFLIPITWGGIQFEWSSWRVIVPLCLGALGLTIFMAWSRYSPFEPILRGSMFQSATALASYLGTVIHGMFLWSVLYYMPLYFEAAKGYSPISSGIALFPWTFTTAPSAVVVGILVAVTGQYRPFIHVGWVLTALGVGLLTLFKPDTPMGEWIPISLISGLGLGILYPAMSFAIQASASNADLPFAAALYSFFRNFGQMLGVAVGGAIFQNEVKKNLRQYVDLAPHAEALSQDASALVEALKGMTDPKQAQMRQEIITAYCDSLRTLWIVMCALAGLALIVGFVFTKAKTLERKLETEQGFVSERRISDEERKGSS